MASATASRRKRRRGYSPRWRSLQTPDCVGALLIGYADFIQTPLPLLTVTLFMLGVQIILMGLLAEMIMRTYHESQDKATFTVRNVLNLDA